MNIEYFITCLAWVFACWYSLKTFMCFVAAFEYESNKIQQSLDYIKGIERTFPVKYYPFVALISIVWLITYYLN